MNLIRKYLKTVSFVFSFLILFTSCSQYDDNTNSDLNSKVVSGEELFKGIFFGNGLIASKLTNYKSYESLKAQFTNKQKAAFIKLQDDLITYINNNSPEYFVSFKNSIDTGNQVIIRNELKKSKEFLKSAIEEITNLKYDAIEKAILKQKSNLTVDLDNINNLKAEVIKLDGFNESNIEKKAASPIWVVVVAVAAAVAVVVVVAFDFWVKTPEGNDMLIENENFINSIAELNAY